MPDDVFENPFEDQPEPKHSGAFPYHDLYKVRNMFFALDIPVFTALESQQTEVQDGHVRFKHIYCCN